jgi:hypothetical protein
MRLIFGCISRLGVGQVAGDLLLEPLLVLLQTHRVLGVVGEKLSSHPGTALSAAATNVFL